MHTHTNIFPCATSAPQRLAVASPEQHVQSQARALEMPSTRAWGTCGDCGPDAALVRKMHGYCKG
eukprot:4967731-Alexandrium_andersonii.AAC.1